MTRRNSRVPRMAIDSSAVPILGHYSVILAGPARDHGNVIVSASHIA